MRLQVIKLNSQNKQLDKMQYYVIIKIQFKFMEVNYATCYK